MQRNRLFSAAAAIGIAALLTGCSSSTPAVRPATTPAPVATAPANTTGNLQAFCAANNLWQNPTVHTSKNNAAAKQAFAQVKIMVKTAPPAISKAMNTLAGGLYPLFEAEIAATPHSTAPLSLIEQTTDALKSPSGKAVSKYILANCP